jgi:hypothetical protein
MVSVYRKHEFNDLLTVKKRDYEKTVNEVTSPSLISLDTDSHKPFGLSLINDGTAYSLSNTVLTKLMNEVGIPNQFARKLISFNMQDKLSDVFNTLITKSFTRTNAQRILRYDIDTKIATGYATTMFAGFDNYLVCDLVKNHFLNDGFEPIRMINDSSCLKVDIIHSDVFQCNNQDYRIGITFINDEAGFSSFKVFLYLYRIVCENGAMIYEDSLENYRFIHVGNKLNQYEVGGFIPQIEFNRLEIDINKLIQLKTLVKSNTYKQNLIQAILRAEDIVLGPVTKNEDTIISFVSTTADIFNISIEKAREVYNNIVSIIHMENRRNVTLFDVVNGLTSLAHSKTYIDSNQELEMLGGKLLTNDKFANKFISALKLAA